MSESSLTGGLTRCRVTGHVWHESRKWARTALKRTARRAGLPLGAFRVYRCERCGGFHVQRRPAAGGESCD